MLSFDQSSGLVFTERTSAQVQSMVPAWTTFSRGGKVNPSSYKHPGNGCSSLQRMVLRYCLWNIDVFDIESLQYLGWHYATQIYEELKKT